MGSLLGFTEAVAWLERHGHVLLVTLSGDIPCERAPEADTVGSAQSGGASPIC